MFFVAFKYSTYMCFTCFFVWLPTSLFPHYTITTVEWQFNRESKISTQKANPGIYSPLSRQVFSHLLENRAPARVMVTWEDKLHHSKHPLLLPPFYWAWWQMVWNVPLVSWGHPGCVSSQAHPPSSPAWKVDEKQKRSRLCASPGQQ